MSYRWFVHEVARRAEIADLAAVEHAVTHILRALGKRLCDIDARAVAAQLPPSLADPFMSAAFDSAPQQELALSGEVDARVVRAACRLLAEMLDEQARAHLRMQPLTSLFTE